MSMNELASRLNITNGALTSHIKKLENCGLITTSSESAVHGNQKIFSIHLDKILIDLEKPAEIENVYHTELKVGHCCLGPYKAECQSSGNSHNFSAYRNRLHESDNRSRLNDGATLHGKYRVYQK